MISEKIKSETETSAGKRDCQTERRIRARIIWFPIPKHEFFILFSREPP